MKTRISGKEAARVAEDMAKPGPIRVVAASEAVAATEARRWSVFTVPAGDVPSGRLG
jgi:hypothetical protein